MGPGEALHAVDELYRAVVTDPFAWDDEAFGAWIAELAGTSTPPDRETARWLRRAVTQARKLARFWSSPMAEAHRRETDWRARVDVAAGPPAWRPTWELARAALEADPDEERFRQAEERFRLVHLRPWLDGGYEEWRSRHG